MVRTFILLAASMALVTSSDATLAESAAYRLSLTVGTYCKVQHENAGYGQQSGDAIALGKIRELCNAAHGYELLVSYTPGSLQGTTIRAGNDAVVLNGSGQAVLSRVDGPRIRERMVSVLPGPAGLDAESLEFSLIAA